MIAQYCTMTEQNITKHGSQKVLPPNSFVKPIESKWLPKHIKDSDEFKWFRADREVFVYCHFGIVIIPISNIRRVN